MSETLNGEERVLTAARALSQHTRRLRDAQEVYENTRVILVECERAVVLARKRLEECEDELLSLAKGLRQ